MEKIRKINANPRSGYKLLGVILLGIAILLIIIYVLDLGTYYIASALLGEKVLIVLRDRFSTTMFAFTALALTILACKFIFKNVIQVIQGKISKIEPKIYNTESSFSITLLRKFFSTRNMAIVAVLAFSLSLLQVNIFTINKIYSLKTPFFQTYLSQGLSDMFSYNVLNLDEIKSFEVHYSFWIVYRSHQRTCADEMNIVLKTISGEEKRMLVYENDLQAFSVIARKKLIPYEIKSPTMDQLIYPVCKRLYESKIGFLRRIFNW